MSSPRRPRARLSESDESAMCWSSCRMNCGITNTPSRNPVSHRSAIRPSMMTLVSSSLRPDVTPPPPAPPATRRHGHASASRSRASGTAASPKPISRPTTRRADSDAHASGANVTPSDSATTTRMIRAPHMRRPTSPLRRDGDEQRLPLTVEQQQDRLVLAEPAGDALKLLHVGHRPAVDFKDQIAPLHAGVLGGASRLHPRDHHALFLIRQTEPLGELRADVVHGQTRHAPTGLRALISGLSTPPGSLPL